MEKDDLEVSSNFEVTEKVVVKITTTSGNDLKEEEGSLETKGIVKALTYDVDPWPDGLVDEFSSIHAYGSKTYMDRIQPWPDIVQQVTTANVLWQPTLDRCISKSKATAVDVRLTYDGGGNCEEQFLITCKTLRPKPTLDCNSLAEVEKFWLFKWNEATLVGFTYDGGGNYLKSSLIKKMELGAIEPGEDENFFKEMAMKSLRMMIIITNFP